MSCVCIHQQVPFHMQSKVFCRVSKMFYRENLQTIDSTKIIATTTDGWLLLLLQILTGILNKTYPSYLPRRQVREGRPFFFWKSHCCEFIPSRPQLFWFMLVHLRPGSCWETTTPCNLSIQSCQAPFLQYLLLLGWGVYICSWYLIYFIHFTLFRCFWGYDLATKNSACPSWLCVRSILKIFFISINISSKSQSWGFESFILGWGSEPVSQTSTLNGSLSVREVGSSCLQLVLQVHHSLFALILPAHLINMIFLGNCWGGRVGKTLPR